MGSAAFARFRGLEILSFEGLTDARDLEQPWQESDSRRRRSQGDGGTARSAEDLGQDAVGNSPRLQLAGVDPVKYLLENLPWLLAFVSLRVHFTLESQVNGTLVSMPNMSMGTSALSA